MTNKVDLIKVRDMDRSTIYYTSYGWACIIGDKLLKHSNGYTIKYDYGDYKDISIYFNKAHKIDMDLFRALYV